MDSNDARTHQSKEGSISMTKRFSKPFTLLGSLENFCPNASLCCALYCMERKMRQALSRNKVAGSSTQHLRLCAGSVEMMSTLSRTLASCA